MKQIVIKILPNGEIKAETLGVKGGECLKYIDIIERLTNATVTDSEFTNEYLCAPEYLERTVEEEVSANDS